MKASVKRLFAVAAGLLVLAGGGLAGYYYWQVNQFQGGPRTIAPDVLVPVYTGPGSLKGGEADKAPQPAP